MVHRMASSSCLIGIFDKFLLMNKQKSLSLIYLTAALVAVAGLLHLVSYGVGKVMLFLAFGPYLYVQTRHFLALKRKKIRLQGLEKKRFYILITLWISMTFTVIDLYPVKFFLLVLVMLDYLMVVQSE